MKTVLCELKKHCWWGRAERTHYRQRPSCSAHSTYHFYHRSKSLCSCSTPIGRFCSAWCFGQASLLALSNCFMSQCFIMEGFPCLCFASFTCLCVVHACVCTWKGANMCIFVQRQEEDVSYNPQSLYNLCVCPSHFWDSLSLGFELVAWERLAEEPRKLSVFALLLQSASDTCHCPWINAVITTLCLVLVESVSLLAKRG